MCGQCGEDPVEICDGLDNNCNGQIDEGLLNACGECGDVPRELCDFVDNDCDGKIDNGVDDCKCTPGTKEPCYDGPSGTQNVGPCKNGIRTCGGDGLWGACEGAVYPTTQACKGVDDDCDGSNNEKMAEACTVFYFDGDGDGYGRATPFPVDDSDRVWKLGSLDKFKQ